ncbi:MAG TPA: polynucleotide adenylyltransferase PcnB [Desulfuromonadales bacterium]|nr:polynucleotide adenylyltransferase PcnB [Desulfuromonadales bacterium]
MLLPRSEHSISRRQLDQNTLKVLYRLHRHGYLAYLVGGSVRDLLLGRKPKDFDVGTDATPAQVKKLFRNCFLVGRRFRLAHICFSRREVVEVATFRRQPGPEELPEDPAEHFNMVQNQFGTPREDAFRRDFTINALFYNIADFSIIDHVGGLEDLAARRLRVIGDPVVRYREDPVRMLRALEFQARLDFSIDEPALAAIAACAPLIGEAAPARVREEILELYRHSVAGPVMRQAQANGLLEPMLGGYRAGENTFVLLDLLDRRTAAGQPVDEAFSMAALFLERFLQKCPPAADIKIGDALQAANQLLVPYCNHFRIAHGIRHQAREILVGCYRLGRGRGRKGERRFLQHPDAPRALELLELWVEVAGGDADLVRSWRQALQRREEAPLPQANPKPPPRRRPRRRRR